MKKDLNYINEKFADIQILQYRINSWEKLNLKQKTFAYYLCEAGNWGRDIIYDQNYQHNLLIRDCLESILKSYKGYKGLEQFEKLMNYIKRFWFSCGFHHHYSADKFYPTFNKGFFSKLLLNSELNYCTYEAYNFSSKQELVDFVVEQIFSNKIAPKKLSLDSSSDMVKNSAVNFYSPDLTQVEVEQFYDKLIDKHNPEPISYGMNSKLIKENGEIKEQIYKVGGLYSKAIEKIVENLKLAVPYAETKNQEKVLNLLIQFYQTGDLKVFDEFSIAWVKDSTPVVDFINGFIEVYEDPLAYKATFESVVSFTDEELSEKFSKICDKVEWFEENLPILPEHKRKAINDVSYKVINIVGVAGDCSPTVPLGINLPNSDWIREKHGSKSVSLSNIEEAHEYYDKHSKFLEEFYTPEQIERQKKFSGLGSKIHTCLHEVIGHGSGRINPGVASPKESLKNYASTLEEARADLVALYFMMDDQFLSFGVMDKIETAKAEYDSYIINGMMGQLKRIEFGKEIEESHMRNRQLIAKWLFEKSASSNAIEKQICESKTYYVIKDYNKLRELVGELLQEVQRIKSEGDYQAGKDLVESYAVKVDPIIHKEVIDRYEKLNEPAYRGFLNPYLKPILNEKSEIVDVQVDYETNFEKQMLYYSNRYKTLI